MPSVGSFVAHGCLLTLGVIQMYITTQVFLDRTQNVGCRRKPAFMGWFEFDYYNINE